MVCGPWGIYQKVILWWYSGVSQSNLFSCGHTLMGLTVLKADSLNKSLPIGKIIIQVTMQVHNWHYYYYEQL